MPTVRRTSSPYRSFLINSIEAKEPAFLQKLRGQYGTTSGRLERPAARPRKLKDGNDNDDDDEPVYVDEESNEVISKAEYQALVGSSVTQKEGEASLDDQSTAGGEDKTRIQKEPTAAKQSNLTEVGGQRKRKQVKVMGEDQPEVEKTKPENEEAQPKPAASRKPKKAKKIKLSFDEE